MATSAARLPDADVIRAMDVEFVRNLAERNAAKLVNAFYADDARLLAPGNPMISGKDAIAEVWNGVLASGVSALTLDTQHIDVSGDLAYGVGQYTMTMAAAGQAPTVSNGKYVVVYRRQPGGNWRAVADIFNSDN